MQLPELEFSFVTDETLRSILEDDYAQARLALEAHAYLGTIVTVGAVLEGLLTWALLTREDAALQHKNACRGKDGKVLPVAAWNLTNLLQVAESLDLLGKIASQGSWAVKDFRNLIHPYKLRDFSSRPDASLALNALSALSEIHRSVKDRFVA
jgi:hypothetical protein